ncbi:MAG: hypothetical protein ACTHWO_09965 [Nesterenkonia sp.]
MAHHNTPRTLADIEQGPGTLHDAICDGEHSSELLHSGCTLFRDEAEAAAMDSHRCADVADKWEYECC